MQKIWLPPKLYQLLPLVYLLSGLLMFAKFGDEPLGLLSASMLRGAAILVWGLRILAGNPPDNRRRD